MNILDYYAHPVIQKRIAEYCGGEPSNPESFTAEYLVGLHGKFYMERGEPFSSMKKSNFHHLLDIGADILRSVWDKENIVGVVDIEYFNLNYPGEAFFKPKEVFDKIEPIYKRILMLLKKYGIEHLSIMTGQGYHFLFKVSIGSATFDQLVKLAKIESTLEGKYLSTHGKRDRIVPVEVGLAYEGMGRVIEYLIHLLLKSLKNYKGIPVVCTDVAIGNREAISIDLSMYGDPLYMRDIRCPFSVYQKHKLFKEKFGETTAHFTPFFVLIPRKKEMDLDKMLEIRSNFSLAIEYAHEVETSIPDASQGLLRLIKSYKFSKLRRFHKKFDSEASHASEEWCRTYDRLDLHSLPPCVSHCLIYPNDHLLKPTNIQTLTRVLLKLGWTPKHIAGLIRSKYERDYNWGKMFLKYDAATRANFYVRLFSGLLFTGIDKEEDLNCVSHKEKGYCMNIPCSHNLENYRL